VSFSEEVREELASAPLPERDCCRRALLSGLIRTAGSYHLRGRGEVHIEVELPAARPARRAVELLRLLGATCEIRTHRERRFQSGQRVEISCAGDDRTLQVLVDAGILSASHAPLARPPARLLARAHCRGAYLRGAFLAAGTVAPPRRPAHLEIRTHDAGAATFLAKVAARDGIALRVRERPSHAAAYTKRLQTLEDLLAHIGASDGVLRLIEGEVVSAARQDANRQANAETANLRRQVVAARRQLSAIGLLDLGALSPGLAAAAALRIEHPELPLAELAVLGELSKATLAGRLRRLEALADDA
jgi:DNA-binding protein WhiA